MNLYRLSALSAALLVALAGQSLIGQSQPSPAPAAGPFDATALPPARPGVDVGPYLGHCGIRGESRDLLRRHRARRRVEDHEQRHDVRSADAGPRLDVDRRRRRVAEQSRPRVGRDGESNNRQSTSWGDGVYKSTDGGKTYTFMGLRTSRYINRIMIDPRNNETVFVAATGDLWGPGGERGVYKTIDGGKTWKQVLKVDDDTGANDLVMDAENSQILYATTYQRRRTRVLHERRRPRQRNLEVHRRRRDMDAPQERRPRGSARPHWPRRLPQTFQHSLCVD